MLLVAQANLFAATIGGREGLGQEGGNRTWIVWRNGFSAEDADYQTAILPDERPTRIRSSRAFHGKAGSTISASAAIRVFLVARFL